MTARHSATVIRGIGQLSRSGVFGLAAGLVLVMGFVSACSRPGALKDPHPASRDPFVGTWRRLDGGYVLRVAATADGVRAEYFNPRPIHVSRAEWGGAAPDRELTVELRDAGYPGSTYTLRHNAADDTLQGVYFQAELKQTFNVAFERAAKP